MSSDASEPVAPANFGELRSTVSAWKATETGDVLASTEKLRPVPWASKTSPKFRSSEPAVRSNTWCPTSYEPPSVSAVAEKGLPSPKREAVPAVRPIFPERPSVVE